MNWISYADLVKDSLALAHRLPRDIVGVLGIPRSGLLPASIIAAELGCHLGDVYTFAQTGGAFLRPGRRMDWDCPAPGVILVLDDSMYMGAAMEQARGALRASPHLCHAFDFQPAVIYASPETESRVSWCQRVVDSPRMFEWNWLGLKVLEKAFCDMDGLLCTDPDAYDDDGPKYEASLQRCKPLHIPTRDIGAIVTGRLERWRDVTEAWLRNHGVRYQALIMAPFGTAEERRAYGAAKWKGNVCREKQPAFYLESNPREAAEIAKLAKCPVVCPPAGQVWG